MSKEKKKSGEPVILKTVQTALLMAIIIVMAYTPVGYLKIGVVEISFLMIPVVVGAVVVGPGAGAFLGAVFGATSFIQCFGASPFGSALLGISALSAFLVCVPTRILSGFFCGLIYKAVNRGKKNKLSSVALSSLTGPLLNTVLFVGTFILLFRKTDYFMKLSAGKNIVAFVGAFVGLNGLIEAAVGFVVATAVSKALIAINGRYRK